ncbi:MAG TPA: hypothetical protein VNT79_07175 [Phycisphaerae bacterium]|nr:hypothetical protein [Phycisphaerae bacterium]
MTPGVPRPSPSLIILVAAAVIFTIAPPAVAELSLPTITGVSNGSAGTGMVADEPAPLKLELGTSFPGDAALDVSADRQLLIYAGGDNGGNPSGGMMVIEGPTRVKISREDNEWVFDVESGRIMASAAGDQADQLLILRAGAEGSAGTVRFAIGQGETDLIVTDGSVEVGFSGEGSLALSVGGADRQLASGKMLTARGSAVSEGDLVGWQSEQGLDFNGVSLRLMMKSATDARLNVQHQLVDNVVAWDKFAQAVNIEPQKKSPTAKPEVRQVVTSVQTNLQSGANRGGTAETPNVQGANEVPSLSPGSVSVGGITAVETNNQRAGGLRTATQSRGLGFNGPSQLASPGFLGGRRTVGPPGLGAQNRGN